MGTPAALFGDPITGLCPVHLVIGPLGVPTPTPGMPFNAPVLLGFSVKTLFDKRPVLLVGATGMNTPPHVGLHPTDPNMVPTTQIGTVVASPATVLVEGLPVAVTGASCTMCNSVPGTIVGSSTVLVG